MQLVTMATHKSPFASHPVRGCLLFFLFLLTVPSLCLNAAPVLKKAGLVTLWQPQAQFAGYYVALEKGIYRKHGIDLRIIPGVAGRTSEDVLRRGEADFAVLWLATAIQERSAGTRLVHLAQIIPASSMMIVSRKSAGIRKIEDLNERKVGLWDGTLSLLPRLLFRKYGITVREVRQSYTVNLFLRGGVEAASAMWYNEYDVLRQSGVDPDELNVLFLNNYGLKFPEDGLYALEKTVFGDPALSAAFVEASFEGWRYAFEHPEEAVGIVIRAMQQAHVPANRSHQLWMLDSMRDLMLPAGKKDFDSILKRGDYEAAARELQSAGVVRRILPYGEFIRRLHEGQ